jgi:hypothetical protein
LCGAISGVNWHRWGVDLARVPSATTPPRRCAVVPPRCHAAMQSPRRAGLPRRCGNTRKSLIPRIRHQPLDERSPYRAHRIALRGLRRDPRPCQKSPTPGYGALDWCRTTSQANCNRSFGIVLAMIPSTYGRVARCDPFGFAGPFCTQELTHAREADGTTPT